MLNNLLKYKCERIKKIDFLYFIYCVLKNYLFFNVQTVKCIFQLDAQITQVQSAVKQCNMRVQSIKNECKHLE